MIIFKLKGINMNPLISNNRGSQTTQTEAIEIERQNNKQRALFRYRHESIPPEDQFVVLSIAAKRFSQNSILNKIKIIVLSAFSWKWVKVGNNTLLNVNSIKKHATLPRKMIRKQAKRNELLNELRRCATTANWAQAAWETPTKAKILQNGVRLTNRALLENLRNPLTGIDRGLLAREGFIQRSFDWHAGYQGRVQGQFLIHCHLTQENNEWIIYNKVAPGNIFSITIEHGERYNQQHGIDGEREIFMQFLQWASDQEA